MERYWNQCNILKLLLFDILNLLCFSVDFFGNVTKIYTPNLCEAKVQTLNTLFSYSWLWCQYKRILLSGRQRLWAQKLFNWVSHFVFSMRFTSFTKHNVTHYIMAGPQLIRNAFKQQLCSCLTSHLLYLLTRATAANFEMSQPHILLLVAKTLLCSIGFGFFFSTPMSQ